MGTKHHRLPRESYRGRISAAFTLCITGRKPFFIDANIVRIFVEFLRGVAEKHTFQAIYCFMPDHSHLILLGTSDESDVLRGVEVFKQVTGFWLRAHGAETKWEKSFHDRIIRLHELGTIIRYILDNPVRKGLISNWREYPFTGAVGLDLEKFLQELGPD
jgi:REP element-mobilizing transposase RayT